jgi:cobalt-precorrin-5B (C1)-methyltransferase
VRGERRVDDTALRTGFTTGSAAAAGAKAALLGLLGQADGIDKVEIPLPEEGRITIPIDEVMIFKNRARAVVIKDAGDDPDVTDGARIVSVVSLAPVSGASEVIIKGGHGVGKVTRPGLPIKVGEPAINPGPRKQIVRAVKEVLQEAGRNYRVIITIEVPEGEEIAKKTLNPRLGIVGGISILGTRGTVIPYSNEAFQATISLALDVAVASGNKIICLSTGRKSGKYLRMCYPALPLISEEIFVEVGDFFAFSLKEVRARKFEQVFYGCFFGKLIKMAQGFESTHAKYGKIDFDLLARWIKEQGVSKAKAELARRANTARQVLEIILEDPAGPGVLTCITRKAIASARRFLGPGPKLIFHLFEMDGRLLVKEEDEKF